MFVKLLKSVIIWNIDWWLKIAGIFCTPVTFLQEMGASFKNRNIVYLLFYCLPLTNRCCLLWLHLSTLCTWTTKNVLDRDLWWLMLPMKNPQKGGKAVNYWLKLCILHWDCVIVKTIFENIAASQNHQWIIHFNSSTKTICWRICMSHFS